MAKGQHLFWQDESDDYESPDDDQTRDDYVDYETPNDQDGFEDENDADYEPPPSNDGIMPNAIFPHKPIPATSDYIGNYFKSDLKQLMVQIIIARGDVVFLRRDVENFPIE